MDYMARALSLARVALGAVSPNPAVGAVIVKGNRIVGQGYTQPPGGSHAEVMALREAGARAYGATLYITLEPCCHYGRTPPCTKALIEAGITEAHVATLDPNPLVAGKGKAELEAAGIGVQVGECEQQACEIIEAHARWITTRLPFVTAKFAMSLDGKIATHTGDSKWISSEESRRYVHYLRYISDAVMVGVNTVLADDPQLTVRCCSHGGQIHKQPLRVIIDGRAKTPLTSRIFSEPGRVLMAVGENVSRAQVAAYEAVGAEVLPLPVSRGLLDLPPLVKALGERNITSVLVEGGGRLLGSLFDARLVDKVITFVAPIIIGGKDAGTPVAGKGVASVIDSIKLERARTRSFNGDTMISGYVGNNPCLPVSSKNSAQ